MGKEQVTWCGMASHPMKSITYLFHTLKEII